MARWITITKVPFDYKWPNATAYTHFKTLGEELVKDEVADFAVSKGYATEGKAADSTTKSKKSGPKATTRRRSAKTARDVAPANNKRVNLVDGTSVAGDDRLDARPSVDEAAE
jgi:hypothetical protein